MLSSNLHSKCFTSTSLLPSLSVCLLCCKTRPQTNRSEFVSLVTGIWTPVRKDNCQNICHYTCIIYKLNYFNRHFYVLDHLSLLPQCRSHNWIILFEPPNSGPISFNKDFVIPFIYTHSKQKPLGMPFLLQVTHIWICLDLSVRTQRLGSIKEKSHLLQREGLQTEEF